jgi:hypothetical protein
LVDAVDEPHKLEIARLDAHAAGQAIEDRAPRGSDQDERPAGDRSGLKEVPRERHFAQCAEAARQRNVGVGGDHPRDPLKEIRCADFFGHPAVRALAGGPRRHRDADRVAAGFHGAAADRLHNAGVAAGAQRVAGFREEPPEPKGIAVRRLARTDSRGTKDGDAAVRHERTFGSRPAGLLA